MTIRRSPTGPLDGQNYSEFLNRQRLGHLVRKGDLLKVTFELFLKNYKKLHSSILLKSTPSDVH